jgi:hypothetical protein
MGSNGLENDKEKYQAYLCSREWSEKREKVRKRAGGNCERCRVFPMDACHHLTYERKYNELLEDLQASCDFCHQFTHGKSDFDPLVYAKLIRYVSRVADDAQKRPVGFEYMMNLQCEIFNSPASAAVMWMYQQHHITNAASAYHDQNGDFVNEETEYCPQSQEWFDLAEQIQRDNLQVDLLKWLDFGSPACEREDHYWIILHKFGFKTFLELQAEAKKKSRSSSRKK